MIIIRYRYREQREFGIPSNIYHSGFKRTYKKWIGIARKKLAKNLYNKSDAIVKEINQERETIKNLPKIENNEIEIKLLDYAKSLGIDVVIENKGKNYFNLQNKMIHLNSETYDIATLAHEIGHAINSTYSTDELIGIISELDNEENFRYKHDNLNKSIKFRLAPTVKEVPAYKINKNRRNNPNPTFNEAKRSFDKYSDIESVIVLEETFASMFAIDLLRDFGASPSELSRAKEKFDRTLTTYKLTSKNIITLLGSTLVNIPSRREIL